MKREDLKGAICATIGHGGATVYFEEHAGRWSGWVPDVDGPTIEAAGAPVWDLRSIEFGVLCRLSCGGPMLSQRNEYEPFINGSLTGPLSKVPYDVWIKPYIDAGATRPYAA